MSLQNVLNSRAPERLHTWSLHAAGLDSGTARGVCEAAPGNLQDEIHKPFDWTRPDCFGLKDRSSEGTGGRASSARSSSHPPFGQRGSGAGPTPPA